VNKRTKEYWGTAEHLWNPDSRETADHSVPYIVAAALMDGTVTLRSFNDAHLRNPELRAFMQKIEVVENPEFTHAFDNRQGEHHPRVTVVTKEGERHVGESAGGKDDLTTPTTDAQITEKFHGLVEDYLSSRRADAILNSLWGLEKLTDSALIPPTL